MDAYKILKSIMKKKKMYINVITQWLISVLIIAGDLAVVANIYIPPILPLYTMDNKINKRYREATATEGSKMSVRQSTGQYDSQMSV